MVDEVYDDAGYDEDEDEVGAEEPEQEEAPGPDKVEVSAEARDALVKLAKARAEKAAAERVEKGAKKAVQAILGSASNAYDEDSGERIAWVDKSPRHGVDTDKLMALYPEVYEAVKTSTEVKTIRLSKTIGGNAKP